MAAKDRLKQKPNSQSAGMRVEVPPPSVRMRMPEIKIPEIKIPEVKIPAADMKPIADVLGQLGQAIAQIANVQTQILKTMQEHHGVIGDLAKRDMTVNVPSPTVKMAPRPRDFYVSLEKEDGETIGMQITAE